MIPETASATTSGNKFNKKSSRAAHAFAARSRSIRAKLEGTPMKSLGNLDHFAALGLIASLMLGCSSRYQPARSPHVRQLMRGGALVHIRDGVVYDSGIDRGLADAVQDNPRAKAEAATFVSDTYWGLGGFLAGLGLQIAGLAVLPRNEHQWQWDGRHTSAVCLWTAGLAAYVVGIGYLVSGAPHQFDAINIYNDDVDAKLQAQFRLQLNAAQQAPRYQLTPPMQTLVPPSVAPDSHLSPPGAVPMAPPGAVRPPNLPAPNYPEPSKIPDCPPDVSEQVASVLFEEADHLIKTGDEHPTREEASLYLSLLEISARSGNIKAQRRLGNYVVGYWITDFMFWPKEKKTAVTALAMLYEAARADPARAQPWERELASGSAVLSIDNNLSLPKAWVSSALTEAKEWERCHPSR